MVEHHPFGKEIKKLFRPSGVGEKTYAAIVVLQVVLFAVAMSLIAGYWMWKERQPAPQAPPQVVNMPVPPGSVNPSVGDVMSIHLPNGYATVTTPPDSLDGYVLARAEIEQVTVSVNGSDKRNPTFRNSEGPSYATAERYRVDWVLNAISSAFRPGENTIEATVFLKNGQVLHESVIIRWVTIEEDPTTATLNIRWLEQPVEVSHYDLVDGENWYASLEDAPIDTLQVWKTGAVNGGYFDGYGVYLFTTNYCDGMFCPINYYRVLKHPDHREVLLLSSVSPELFPNEYAFVAKKLPNVRVPELELPHTFNFQGLNFTDSVELGLGTTSAAWFTDQELRSVGVHPIWGTVYTTVSEYNTDRGAPSNAFYLRTPDNRVYTYKFAIPFIADGKIPRITWIDGDVNSVDYQTGDHSGCGALNAYAVRPESVLRPVERLIVGGHTSTNDPVYLLKNDYDDELKDEYEQWYPYNPDGPASKPSYESFVAMKPIFYWKDPFNRWIRFKRADLQPMAECGKPVIYLYPEKEMPVHVMVGLKGEMTVSEPEHGATGWDVIAKTDGYVVNNADGKTYPNLFWEGTGVGYDTPKQGFVVVQKDVARWLEKTLDEIGFTERESAEFREFWLPRLPQSPYLFITFVPQSDFDRDAPLFISPKPDSVSRVFMEYHPLYAPEVVEPLPLPKIERRGFAVVEWGGALR